ncbi:MAG: maleylpyruvate isomerase family mycothiol-dependent enzyme [Arthrobacter sp.]|nr:maleylpyruvate isomerase family mycothiol-dependent enzyme [Arthrobacter sp.]
MTEIDALIDAERTRLVDALEGLDAEQWNEPSLCAGWRVRDVAVHLLMPYEMSVPRFFGRMAASGFKFDAMADRWATGDTRPTRDIVDALRATKEGRFGIPGAPPEAPLCHLVIHAEDIYRPLGIDRTINPQSANIVLDQLVGPKARRALKSGLIDGLALSAHDTGWSYGTGAEVTGNAAALISTLSGRPQASQELTGDGAARVQRQLLSD